MWFWVDSSHGARRLGEGAGGGLGVDEGNVEYIFLCLVDRSILIELQTVTFYSGSYVFICIIYI